MWVAAHGGEERAASGPEALRREGWTRRFVAAPPRLAEAVALYESLGFEVRVERVGAGELPPGCEGCPLALHLFRAIYTRRRG